MPGGRRLSSGVGLSDPPLPLTSQDEIGQLPIAAAARVSTITGQDFPSPDQVVGQTQGCGDERDALRITQIVHLLSEFHCPLQVLGAGADDRRRTNYQRGDGPPSTLVEDRDQVLQTTDRIDAHRAVLLDHVVAAEGDDESVVGTGQHPGQDFLPAATHYVLGSVAPDTEIEGRDVTAPGLQHPADPAPVFGVTDPLNKRVTDEADTYVLDHPANRSDRLGNYSSEFKGRTATQTLTAISLTKSRTQVMWEQSPGAAGPYPVRQGIDDLPARTFRRPPARFRRRNQWFEHHPLRIGKIRRIRPPTSHPHLPEVQELPSHLP